jgi:hypothetical protein
MPNTIDKTPPMFQQNLDRFWELSEFDPEELDREEAREMDFLCDYILCAIQSAIHGEL